MNSIVYVIVCSLSFLSCSAQNATSDSAENSATNESSENNPSDGQNGEIYCVNGLCSNSNLYCNDTKDCFNDSAEGSVLKDCSDGFSCGDGVCIEKTQVCDGVVDCIDFRDELRCNCSADEFFCRNESCIPRTQRCDGKKDCDDGSDEEDCPKKPDCLPNEFICKIDRHCVPYFRWCDGAPDCRDGTDEINCPILNFTLFSPCFENEFECKSHDYCVPTIRRCDGISDCRDNSDEEDCPTTTTTTTTTTTVSPIIQCQFDQFKCEISNRCIPSYLRCNDAYECEDGADEYGCPTTTTAIISTSVTTTSAILPIKLCRPDQFRCGNDDDCIPLFFRCDGRYECRDGSDEYDCPSTTTKTTPTPSPFTPRYCRQDQFKCFTTSTCIPSVYQCDGRPDCPDNSDEYDCPSRTRLPLQLCGRYEFSCRDSGRCLPTYFKCNGQYECTDGSDEEDCGSDQSSLSLKVYPNNQLVLEGQDAVFMCRDEGPLRARIQWSRSNGLPLPTSSRVNNEEGRFEIPYAQLEYEDTYICRATGEAARLPGSEITAKLRVTRSPRAGIQPSSVTCGINEATCQNGTCIPKQFVCNGRPDCPDGSDEFRCSSHSCEPSEFRCSNRKCIQKIWICDGEDDCGDLSDEKICTPNPPGTVCRHDEFQCTNNQCIPKYLQCDFERDCADASDEVGCSKVIIIQDPPRDIRLQPGSVFKISCKTIGTPTPEVIWRLNWGHVPAKCKSTSINGVGVLTCPDIQTEDAGAYSCEGINSKGSTFAKDTILTVLPRYQLCQPDQYKNSAGECINCFCSGVSTDCKSSWLPVKQIVANAIEDGKDFKIAVRWQLEENSPPNFIVDKYNRELIFRAFDKSISGEYYWSLPKKFLGNKATSLGGFLNYTIRFVPVLGSSLTINAAPDVELISGNYDRTHLFYFNHVQPLQPNIYQTISVPLLELRWKRADGGPVSRALLLEALTNIKSIYIKATYTHETQEVGLRDVVLDVGDNSNGAQKPSYETEECRCPVEYSGLSCEKCKPGYYKVRNQQRNLCIPCECYGNARTCDPETGVCLNCENHTIGDHCSQCEPGFRGNPLFGEACKQFPYARLPRECPRGQYANSADQCVDCFCSGVSNECNSITLAANQIVGTAAEDSSGFKIGGRWEIEGNLPFNPLVDSINEELVFRSFKPNAPGEYYWSLPEKFLGNKVSAYGGTLSYTIRFVPVPGSSLTISPSPDVELISRNYNRTHLFYFNPAGPLQPNVYHTIRVPLVERRWQRADGRVVHRGQLLAALTDIKSIFIKATYTTETQEVGMKSVILDVGENGNAALQSAYVTEECRCPAGYTGRSCEKCETGYYRVQEEDRNSCVPCDCHGHARTCDSETGICLNCENHTIGDHCSQCEPGFRGNPLFGEACKQFPYTRVPRECPRGQYANSADQCVDCFCSEVSNECNSITLAANQIVSSATEDNSGFKIGGRWEIEGNPPFNPLFDSNSGELVFRSFKPNALGEYYWSLPEKFLGNKVANYGGNLRYTIRFIPVPGSPLTINTSPDVEIISRNYNRSHLFYFNRAETLQPNLYQTITVPLLERRWQRADGRVVHRGQLLAALTDIKTIFIKATYTPQTQEVGLRSVVLDVGENNNPNLQSKYVTEECRCPTGYAGLSCEKCEVGYYRTYDVDRSICVQCVCNGHASSCDPETGICSECGNHTVGEHCAQCQLGFRGNPLNGEPCVPIEETCAATCDLRGSYSSECRNGQCVCKVNVEGERCDTCKRGTYDLQQYRVTGCLECYCSGATNICTESKGFVSQIRYSVSDSDQSFTLTDRIQVANCKFSLKSQIFHSPYLGQITPKADADSPTHKKNHSQFIQSGLRLNIEKNQVEYDGLFNDNQFYWSLPSLFRGNRIASYGSNLTWTQGFRTVFDAAFTRHTDMEIFGDGISVFWYNNIPIRPDTTQIITVTLDEQNLFTESATGERLASRMDVMRVLSSVDVILIRASYVSQAVSAFIANVSLDTVVAQPVSSIRAPYVEMCQCPIGYKGSSCESCTLGYYKTVSTSITGKECRKCPCNENEERCYYEPSNAKTICVCRSGFSGEFCQERETNNVNSVWPLRSTNERPPSSSSLTLKAIINEPTRQTVAVGTTVRYYCRGESLVNRPVTVRWSKNGENLPDSAFDPGNGYLILINTISSDSGTYVCRVSDGQSYVEQHATLLVTDVSAPKIIISPLTPSNKFEVRVGDPFNVNCEGTGTPIPNVEWGRENGSPAYKKSGYKSLTFQIGSVSKSDEGVYYCRARNIMGTDNQKIYINVKDEGSNQMLALRVQPSDKIVREGDDTTFWCRDESPLKARVTWIRKNGLVMPTTSRITTDGRIDISNVQLADAGNYTCIAVKPFDRLPGSEASVYLHVAFPLVRTRRRPMLVECKAEEVRCNNGYCIPNDFICNSRADCTDGSDEMHCDDGYYGCEPSEFHCNNRRCIRKVWRCDSHDDCGDNSDEVNCTDSSENSFCNYNQFQCAHDNQCVPRAFHCDNEIDCSDKSDEIGCSKVMITRGPLELVNLSIGDLFNITCYTVGIPTPEVVWRFNGNYIPSKCSSSSKNGIGVLTCPNIQEEDQGNYSCEGINSIGSAFAANTSLRVYGRPR